MKRRNAEGGKLRRPLKRSKIPDGFYGSLFMYVRFLLVWLLVLFADFILEFRFEYLWPFWLLLRSAYDSFKYQGLAFSVFFVCIALTSDMICFLFIPVHWLFFAASTYVWVQFVWHTERGICLPTVSLWLLFVYIEASIRLRELKNLPFHMDLCRPFASHCIGYPVVTLGFGFKSYVGYRMRQRKQKEVSKENEFYMQLVKQALPQEQQFVAVVAEKASKSSSEEIVSNGVSTTPTSKKSGTTVTSTAAAKSTTTTDANKFSEVDPKEARRQQLLSGGSSTLEKELEYMENELCNGEKRSSVNDYNESVDIDKDKSFKSNGVVTRTSPTGRFNQTQQQHNQHHHHHHIKENKENVITSLNSQKKGGGGGGGGKNNVTVKDGLTYNQCLNQKDEHSLRLEADIKRLKADLQGSRQCELDLRSQINNMLTGERSVKNELSQYQQDNENLQAKLHGLVTARQHDKQSVTALERKFQEERRLRTVAETQLANERKLKKAESEAAARALVLNNTNARQECTDSCKARRRELENDCKQLRRDLKLYEDRIRQAEREAQALRQYKESHNEAEVLMLALSAMQDKNSHLENSLSAETRLKLDLFSALGDAKRQLEISQSFLMQKDREIDELKSRIAEVMAVMPPTNPFPPVSLDSSIIISSPHYASKFVHDETITTSNLDPNASVYTPKGVGSGGVSPVDDLL